MHGGGEAVRTQEGARTCVIPQTPDASCWAPSWCERESRMRRGRPPCFPGAWREQSELWGTENLM